MRFLPSLSRRSLGRDAPVLSFHLEKNLRRQVGHLQDGTLKPGECAAFALQEICVSTAGIGTSHRGSAVSTAWGAICEPLRRRLGVQNATSSVSDRMSSAS